MKNQDIVLVKDNNSTYSGNKNVALELNYRNGDQRLNVKVFFAKAWHDIISKFGFILHPRKKLNIDLNGAYMLYAHDAIHLVRAVDRKSPEGGIHHKHFIDLITGCEYCGEEAFKCRHAISYDIPSINGNWNYSIFSSPINFINSEEFVKINSYNISREEKLSIIYSMLRRANESYQEQKVKKLNK